MPKSLFCCARLLDVHHRYAELKHVLIHITLQVLKSSADEVSSLSSSLESLSSEVHLFRYHGVRSQQYNFQNIPYFWFDVLDNFESSCVPEKVVYEVEKIVQVFMDTWTRSKMGLQVTTTDQNGNIL